MTPQERAELKRRVDEARRFDLWFAGGNGRSDADVDTTLAKVFDDYEPEVVAEAPGDWMPQIQPPRERMDSLHWIRGRRR